MNDGWTVAILALGYVGALFVLAWIGDRFVRARAPGQGRPLIYALSLAVYCTSWTFFGSVGLAATTGYDFIPVYLGPILLSAFGWPLILRIVRLAKSQNITSVADFLAARYGKSPGVAALVAAVAVAGTLPYMALQLKAIAVSIETLLGPSPTQGVAVIAGIPIDTALLIALVLAAFAVLFGTRHVEATEHQNGLMLAIAAESLVKLAAFLAIGIFVVMSMLGGPLELVSRIRTNPELQLLFASGLNGGVWLTVMFLSLVCIILLPRQFHVTVVENYSESEVRRAAWLFPLYLVLINLFVVPIAAAGLLLLAPRVVQPDMFVLALPLSVEAQWLAIIAFIGGISAATAMVIVDGVALAIMICNGFVVPWLVRRQIVDGALKSDLAALLMLIRRVAIFVILLLAYFVYMALGGVHQLAQIGLISFAAIAQLAPAFFGGLVWRRATARGAIAGIVAGFTVWAYTLLLPWIAEAGFVPLSLVNEGPFGIGLLKPQALLYLHFDRLTHGVLWSIFANIVAYVVVSLLRPPLPIERLQARVFVIDDLPRPALAPGFRIWRTTLTVGDLQQTAARYLGDERADRSFRDYAASRNITLSPSAEADLGTLNFVEHLLASAIGAASARIVITLLIRRGNVADGAADRLLDDASEAIQYNRDLLQSAVDQVRHGLSVFNKDMQLVCWNRQFRELLAIPEDLGRFGVPLEQILRRVAEAGMLGEGNLDQRIAQTYVRLTETRETFRIFPPANPAAGRPRPRVIEIRTSPMPQGGIVTTYSDVTERAAIADALEQHVRERTAKITEMNEELKVAKAKADEANLDKTRFIAAASHDILQPLNAGRLYASTLVERRLGGDAAQLARNIDASLEAVEEIIRVLLDLSRLDAGDLAPQIRSMSLAEVLDQLRVEFEPMALAKGLELRFAPTTLWVRSDRLLLRRVLQNLISNAVKYTRQGGVVVGCRRRGDEVLVQVSDTGPGIPAGKRALIFKEFHRLEETAANERGLGLGLSIVERICRVLGTRVSLASNPGRGSTFSVSLPRAQAGATTAHQPASGPIGIDVAGSVAICIDNEPSALDGMRALLTTWGCEVVLAANKSEALAALAGLKRPPDVIIADFHLNEGTGLDVIAALNAAVGREIPSIIVTADHSSEMQSAVRAAGLALLRKPIKAAALRSLLGQYTLRRRAAAE